MPSPNVTDDDSDNRAAFDPKWDHSQEQEVDELRNFNILDEVDASEKPPSPNVDVDSGSESDDSEDSDSDYSGGDEDDDDQQEEEEDESRVDSVNPEALQPSEPANVDADDDQRLTAKQVAIRDSNLDIMNLKYQESNIYVVLKKAFQEVPKGHPGIVVADDPTSSVGSQTLAAIFFAEPHGAKEFDLTQHKIKNYFSFGMLYLV